MNSREEARRRYFAGEKKSDIARFLGISRQRVSQLTADMDMDKDERNEKVRAWKEWLRGEEE